MQNNNLHDLSVEELEGHTRDTESNIGISLATVIQISMLGPLKCMLSVWESTDSHSILSPYFKICMTVASEINILVKSIIYNIRSWNSY